MTSPSGDVQPSGTGPGATEGEGRDPNARDTESQDARTRDAETRDAETRDVGDREADYREDARYVSNAGAVRRPPEMVLGAAFLTVAALPSIMIGGVMAALVGRLGAALRDRIVAAAGTMDPDSLVLAARIAGAVALLAGVAFIALAWLAVQPKRWARPIVAALAAAEMALLVAGMVATAPDPVSIGLTLLAGAGVALLYLPRSEEFLLSHG